jgi:hypothetical protein
MGQIHHWHTSQNYHHCFVAQVEIWVASVEIQMAVSVNILVVPAESLVAFLVDGIPRVSAERR